MTTHQNQNRPKPGEYWGILNKPSVRIIGFDGDECVVRHRDGRLTTLAEGNWSRTDGDWHHIPWCKSFDDVEPTQDQYPQYVIHYQGFSDDTAYLRRDSATKTVAVSRSGVESESSWDSDMDLFIRIGLWSYVTDEEAKSRLTPTLSHCFICGVKVSPLGVACEDCTQYAHESVGVPIPPPPSCPDCGEPVTAGHADVCPMAWVEIDKAVYPDHEPRKSIDVLLAGCDANTEASGRSAVGAGMYWSISHSTWNGWKFVCRRKDLPPATEPAIDPGDGYRLINTAVDVPMDGDEMWLIAEQKWEQRAVRVPFSNRWTYRRKITPEKKRIPLRVWVSDDVVANETSKSQCVLSQQDIEKYGYIEVHGLNIFIEESS